MNLKISKAVSILCLLVSSNVFATAYNMPSSSRSLVGGDQVITANENDNATTVAKRYDIGFNALENANPHLDLSRGLPEGAAVVIPNKHLLPNQREGIVINLPEMRMYYFPAGSNQVFTYPIGIGKIGKTIPIINTAITRKTKNPTWTPPKDIREFNLQQGIVLPRVMPAGPDNPLGPYAIYMRLPTYLIHSTIFPESVGKRASFGCIRMYEEDINDFFPSVTGGIPVAIINKPTKIGWQDEKLYMETFKPLEEHHGEYDATLSGVVHQITEQYKNQPTLVDWQLVAYIAKEKDGTPHEIGMKLPQ